MATDLKGELTCPICMELFHRPLRLPCGHSYCRNCLQVFIGQQSQKDIVTGQNRPVKCPECRYMLDVTSQGADTFPVDFKLSKLVDVYMKMEDMENSNETKKANSKDDDHEDDTIDPTLLGACGYTPTEPHHPQPEQEVKEAPDKSEDEPVTCVKSSDLSDRTRKKVVYGDSSETDSDKDDSDDSANRTGPRRRKRRNKVIRFFASLLSLSSSDGEYDLREASSSSSDNIDTSRPVRDVKPAPPKEVPRRRNRWGFFTSSSSESEQNVASSDEEGQQNGRPPRRKPPQRKSSNVITSIQRRLKPSSSDDEMIK